MKIQQEAMDKELEQTGEFKKMRDKEIEEFTRTVNQKYEAMDKESEQTGEFKKMRDKEIEEFTRTVNQKYERSIVYLEKARDYNESHLNETLKEITEKESKIQELIENNGKLLESPQAEIAECGNKIQAQHNDIGKMEIPQQMTKTTYER
jgi:hypothetical protein